MLAHILIGEHRISLLDSINGEVPKFPSQTTAQCKTRNFTERETVIPWTYYFVFYRQQRRIPLFDTHALHRKMSVGPRITKANGASIAKTSNNIK